MAQVSEPKVPFFDQKERAEAILRYVEVRFPTRQEVQKARLDRGLTLAEMGRQVGRYKVGWLHGEPLNARPYTRSAIHQIESGKIGISKRFAVAFRRWTGELQNPDHIRVINEAVAVMDIPPGTVIACGVLATCHICGRLLLCWPGTKYCPPSIDDCRKVAKRRRERERRRRIREERRNAQREAVQNDRARIRSGRPEVATDTDDQRSAG